MVEEICKKCKNQLSLIVDENFRIYLRCFNYDKGDVCFEEIVDEKLKGIILFELECSKTNNVSELQFFKNLECNKKCQYYVQQTVLNQKSQII